MAVAGFAEENNKDSVTCMTVLPRSLAGKLPSFNQLLMSFPSNLIYKSGNFYCMICICMLYASPDLSL